MRVVILRGRVSIGLFLLGGVFICLFEGCSEDSMYLFFSFFLDTLFLYMRSCDHLLTYIVFFSLFILMYVFLSPTPSCVVSFSPNTHVSYICLQFIISVLHKDALMGFV